VPTLKAFTTLPGEHGVAALGVHIGLGCGPRLFASSQ